MQFAQFLLQLRNECMEGHQDGILVSGGYRSCIKVFKLLKLCCVVSFVSGEEFAQDVSRLQPGLTHHVKRKICTYAHTHRYIVPLRMCQDWWMYCFHRKSHLPSSTTFKVTAPLGGWWVDTFLYLFYSCAQYPCYSAVCLWSYYQCDWTFLERHRAGFHLFLKLCKVMSDLVTLVVNKLISKITHQS